MTTHREEFTEFSDFLVAVAQAGIYPGKVDPRLVWAAASGANEGYPSEGGFLVPSEMAAELWEKAYDIGVLLNLCDRQPITKGNVLKVPSVDEQNRAAGSRLGGLQTYWSNEADTVTATKPKFRSVDLYLNKLMGLGYATDELFDDVPALVAILSRAFALEAGTVIEDCIISGPGAGSMLGLLNSNATIEIAPESGQAAATVRTDNVLKMWARCWAPSMRRAIWLYNQDAGPQIFSLALGTGSASVRLATFEGDGPRLMGRPLIAHESCKTVGTRGDLILFDPSQYLIAEKPPSFAQSLHLKFVQDEACFRFSWRIGGSPAWSSAITPLNGTSTVSPYIVLGNR